MKSQILITLIGSNGNVECTIKNNEKKPVRILIWGTPFDSIESDCFAISIIGSESVSYRGVKSKRTFKQDLSTIYLAPGESISHIKDAANSYQLDALDEYSVQLSSSTLNCAWVKHSADKLELDDFHPIKFENVVTPIKLSPKERFNSFPELPTLQQEKIDGFEPRSFESYRTPIPVCPPFFLCISPSYHLGGECVRTRYVSYPDALNFNSMNREQLFRDVYLSIFKTYTVSETGGWTPKRWDFHRDPVYRKWFGSYNKTRGIIVAKTLTAICFPARCLSFYVYSNSLDGDVIAYWQYSPNPSIQNSILGVHPRFWRLGNSGINTMSGTICHELSHGYKNTKDHAYGTLQCQRLALASPDLAIENADNYQYYLEEKKPFLLTDDSN